MPYTVLPKQSRRSYLLAGKHTLIGLAVLMGISIIFISNYNSGGKGGRVLLSGNEQPEKKGQSIMVNPRYFGVDSKNRPFNVSANEAEQIDKNNIGLKAVQADMLLDETKWLALTADQGKIKDQGNEIELQKNVQMFYEGGYEFRSDYVIVRPNQGYASGNQPVQGQSPTGTLEADSFEVVEHGDQMIFRNNVRTTIYLDGQ